MHLITCFLLIRSQQIIWDTSSSLHHVFTCTCTYVDLLHKHSPFLNTPSYLKEQLTMTNPLLMVLHPIYGDLDQDWHLVTCHTSIWCYATMETCHLLMILLRYHAALIVIIMQVCPLFVKIQKYYCSCVMLISTTIHSCI